MAMVAKKPLDNGTTTKKTSTATVAGVTLPIRGANANGLPGINLEGNRIAREAVVPSSATTLENAAADLTAQKATAGVTAGVAGIQGAVTPTKGTKKSTGGNAAVQPTNPYAAQMEAAQNMLGTPRPTYTAPTATAAPVQPTYTAPAATAATVQPTYTAPATTAPQVKPTYNNSYTGKIAEHEASAPGAYTSKYQPNIDGLLDQLQNREAFEYSFSEDPLYRQLAAKHMEAGKRAMQDTMAQAAALTSGYGNSYASTAAGQAYQQHVNQLNDDAIDLYTMARENYNAKGDEMRSNLAALQSAESMERSNYESDRADYYNRLAALREGEAVERQQYQDELNQYNTDRSYDQAQQQIAWGQYQDELDQYNTDRSYDQAQQQIAWGQYQDQLNQYNTDRNYDQTQQQIAWNQHMDEQSLWSDEQQRAWEQYKYWNDLWEEKQSK